MTRPRFGFQLTHAHLQDPVASARRAEEVGFDVVLVADHLGGPMSPLPALAAMAASTERVRLGTYVLNNEMRNPVQLAWDVVAIDRLSGGRFELGMGAGHTPSEFAAAGIEMPPARIRKERLLEALGVLRRLVDGETVDHDGAHYRLSGACVGASAQSRLPILVGGSGSALLHATGAHADGVGLTGTGRTLADGHRHEVRWTAEWLDAQLAQVAKGAGPRMSTLDVSALVQMVDFTDDRSAVLAGLADELGGLTEGDAGETPYLMIGTVDEIVAHVLACTDRWGITTYVVRALDEFEPVIAALR